MMEWKRLFMEHQTLWVDRCLLRDLWLWLCPPAMYSSIWKESSRSSCKLFMCGCLLSIMKEKHKRKMFHHVFAIGLVLYNHQYHNLRVILFSCQPCFLLYYSISDWCPVLYMVWIYVCEEEFWESVQEDALFLLWNILCILISKRELCFLFVVLECLYLIHLGGAAAVVQKMRSGVKVG